MLLDKGHTLALLREIWKTEENQWNNNRSQTTTFFGQTLIEKLIKQTLLEESQIKKPSQQGKKI